MPPRFAYWTIILDGTPTSFRAREREELLPTFNQLKKKDPGAIMKWFSGGTLWDSPEQASEKRRLDREARTPPPLKSPAGAMGSPVRREGWRPGGDHKDPKDKYKLPPGEARKRWKKRNLGAGKMK